MTRKLYRRDIVARALGFAGTAILSGCTTATVLSTPQAISTTDATADALPLVNRARAAKGLPPLSIDPVAARAAQDQAMRMAQYQTMSHYLGSESFFARMKRNGVSLPAAENIAMGQQTVDQVVAAWIKSPRHFENMTGRYGGLGVALARNADIGNRPFWAMVLSNPGTDQARLQW